MIEKVATILKIDETKDNPVDKFPWVPFGKSLVPKIQDTSNENVALLMNNLAIVLKDLGDYTGAKTLLEKAMVSDEKNFGPEHPSTARSYSNLALVLKDLEVYEKALELSAKSVKIFTSTLPAGHPNIKWATDVYNSIKKCIERTESYR